MTIDMPSLLTIAKELRDYILELVLLHEREPPLDPASAGDTYSKAFEGRFWDRTPCLSWNYGPSHVRYENQPPPPTARGLLLCNEQLNHETNATLQRIFPNGASYKADVMFVNEAECWLTWLRVPVVAKQIHSVDIKFRIFDVNDTTLQSAFRAGDGSPPQIVWCFYYMLERLLFHGLNTPVKADQVSPMAIPILVHSINLHFQSADPDQPALNDDPEGDEQRDAFGVMRPEYLAKFVRRDLLGLLHVGYHGTPYGSILHDAIGRFTITANQQSIGRLEVGDILAKLSKGPDSDSEWYTMGTFGNLPGDCRLLTFWNWKYRMVERRKGRGLPLPEEIVWPTMEGMTTWRAAAAVFQRDQKANGLQWNCDGKRCLCSEHSLEDMLKESREVDQIHE